MWPPSSDGSAGMIIDAHAHALPFVGGKGIFDSEADHMRFLQRHMTTHPQGCARDWLIYIMTSSSVKIRTKEDLRAEAISSNERDNN